MKPHFHRVPVPLQNSFSVRHDKLLNFGKPFHYHPELELHFTIKGEGIRLIGDNVSHFREGEIILLGENLPHAWRGKESNDEKEQLVEAMVIQFAPHCFGKAFFQLPELYRVPRLFELAKKGLLIQGESAAMIRPLMYRIVNAGRMERIICLLEILQIIVTREEITPIASAHAFYKGSEQESLRLNHVIAFTLSNFKRDINLDEVAALANFSTNAFCRYFKSLTNKTYHDFLREIRVSHACRMIMEDRYAMGIICYECGFNNVSNFYRHFKKLTGCTPFEYKRKHIQKCVA